MLVRANPRNEAARLALSIYESTLAAVEGSHLVRQALSLQADLLFVQNDAIDLPQFSRILVAGAGKASLAMARGVVEVLGDRIDEGLIVTKEIYDEPLPGFEVLEGGHPVPDLRSLEAGRRMLDFAASAGDSDLVIFLLSGGASALMERLPSTLDLASLQELNESMLRSGTDIRTINGTRRQLSRIKNGRLAQAFRPATVIALVISDVIGANALSVVGSGPLMPPERNLPDAGWLAPFHLDHSVDEEEPGARVPHYVIGSASLAIQEAATMAVKHGLVSLPFSNPLSGDNRRMTRKIMQQASVELERQDQPFCMIFGGETTVTLKGDGLGGRCQDMVMAATPKMRHFDDCALLVAGTDGSDGPTTAAGGIIDSSTCRTATVSWLQSVRNDDSYRFLESADALIFTGPTGSNVNDLALFVSVPS